MYRAYVNTPLVNFIIKMTVCLYEQAGWPACRDLYRRVLAYQDENFYNIINSHKWAGLAAGMKVQRCGRELFLKRTSKQFYTE